jgi:hypothetical protein
VALATRVSGRLARMTEPNPNDWTDHNVHDPGITLLELVAYSIGALGFATATVALRRRRRRSLDGGGRCGARG